MGRTMPWMIVALIIASTASAWAHEAHEHAAKETNEGGAQLQNLTGEVVDVMCYLSHGEQGIGPKHAECAKKCIGDGLPVALKIGDQLYVASMADHTPANKALAPYAGQRVTVHGQQLERDGQHLIVISRVEKAN